MAQVRTHAEAISAILSTRKPASQRPSNRNSILHTYRHILRELSYLPPAVRKRIQEPIVKRFHQHQHNTRGLHDDRRRDRARNVLRMLRSANSGGKLAYQALIEKAFGRSWIRRHQLMEQHFLQKSAERGPQNSEQLAEAAKKQNILDTARAALQPGISDASFQEPLRRRGYQRFNMDEILKALKLQRSRQQKNPNNRWPLGPIHKIDGDKHVPDKNIWGKEPAPELVATKQEKYWNIQIGRLEAPLDKSEWDLLEQLSRGLQDMSLEWKMPKRRTPAQHGLAAMSEEGCRDWNWELFASQPISTIEKEKRHNRQRRSGERPLGPYGRQASTAKAPSARWFRRAYLQTLMLSPYSELDPETKEKTLKWGSLKLRAAAPSPMQMAVFEGAAETPPKRRRGRNKGVANSQTSI